MGKLKGKEGVCQTERKIRQPLYLFILGWSAGRRGARKVAPPKEDEEIGRAHV